MLKDNSYVVRGLKGPSPQLNNLVSSFPKVHKATLLTTFVLSREAILNSGVFKEGWWVFNPPPVTRPTTNFSLSWDVKKLKCLQLQGASSLDP